MSQVDEINMDSSLLVVKEQDGKTNGQFYLQIVKQLVLYLRRHHGQCIVSF